ncbi:MAG TPA: hypothetical protein VEI97_08440 [bacterium]|nr:hypothetical protein [bacterium]
MAETREMTFRYAKDPRSGRVAADVPEVEGIYTTADTLDDARLQIRDQLHQWAEGCRERGEPSAHSLNEVEVALDQMQGRHRYGDELWGEDEEGRPEAVSEF